MHVASHWPESLRDMLAARQRQAHGLGIRVAVGAGLHVEGLMSEATRIGYPRRDDCMGHDTLGELVPLGATSTGITLGALLDRAEKELGEGAVLDLSRDVIVRLTCPDCGEKTPGRAVLGAVRESQAACPKCKTHRVVEIATSIDRSGEIDLAQTPAELGLPPFDVIVARNGMDRSRAWLFDGDARAVLGPLYEEAQT